MPSGGSRGAAQAVEGRVSCRGGTGARVLGGQASVSVEGQRGHLSGHTDESDQLRRERARGTAAPGLQGTGVRRAARCEYLNSCPGGHWLGWLMALPALWPASGRRGLRWCQALPRAASGLWL